MRSISDSDLLGAWEKGVVQRPAQIGLSLLLATSPDVSYEELSILSIGERDRLLLQLREEIFGSRITGLIRCPECGELLEISFDVSDIGIESRIETPQTEGCILLECDGYEISFRLPDCADLQAISHYEDVTEARYMILRRCIQRVLYKARETSIEYLPPNLLYSVEERMASADPLADVLLRTACASCRHEWDALFDISSFLWKEIDSWAHHTLQDVHTLAATYGWSEENILGMSSWRRKCYLDIVSI